MWDETLLAAPRTKEVPPNCQQKRNVPKCYIRQR